MEKSCKCPDCRCQEELKELEISTEFTFEGEDLPQDIKDELNRVFGEELVPKKEQPKVD